MKGKKHATMWTMTALMLVLSLALPWTALADQFVNKLDTTPDIALESATIAAGGSVTIGFYIVATTGGDDASGCNATGSAPAYLTLTPPAGVSVSWAGYPTALELIGCDATTYRNITFSSSTPGSYTINGFSLTGGKSGSVWDYTTAYFTLNVTGGPSDTTPPTADPEQDPEANDYGWNNTDVTIYWNWDDEEGGSGIDEEDCEMTTVVTLEGEYVDVNEVTATCYDLAGNEGTASYAVKIDKTDPTVTVTGVENGATYIKGSVPEAGCSTEDALSGVQTDATVNVTGGSLVDPSVGTFVATCSGGTDYADNVADDVSVKYYVHYNWNGFFQPVDNERLNVAKAGSAIPVKFSLAGDQELDIFAVGYPGSYRINCTTNALEDAIETTVTAGQSSLNYDPDADQYIYVWKTLKDWAGTCRRLDVMLIDGTSHTADFRFK